MCLFSDVYSLLMTDDHHNNGTSMMSEKHTAVNCFRKRTEVESFFPFLLVGWLLILFSWMTIVCILSIYNIFAFLYN